MSISPLKKIMFLGLGVLAPLIYVACGSSGSSSNNPDPSGSLDQNQMLKEIAENVILPSYKGLSSRAGELQTKLLAFCENPDLAKLQTAQTAWKATQDQLAHSETFGFGPYISQGFDNEIHFWPTQPNYIETAISAYEEFTPEVLASLTGGVSTRGLPALEYLLFDAANDSQKILDNYTQGENALNRCNFLVAIGNALQEKTSALQEAWEASGGNYAQALASAGQSGSSFSTLHDAISTIVNELAFSVDYIRDTKLAQPMGLKSGSETPLPETVENPYSHYSKESIVANLQGFQDLYRGSYNNSQGLGFKDLVKEKNANASEVLDQLIGDAMTAANAIPGSLAEALIQNPASVENTYEKVKTLRDYIYGPLASLLGVTTKFSDNDGD
jgi:putative iron-regulated protein